MSDYLLKPICNACGRKEGHEPGCAVADLATLRASYEEALGQVASMLDLRAENERLTKERDEMRWERSMLATLTVRAERAEAIITKARKRMAALNDALEADGHDEPTETGMLAARVNAELWPHEPLRTALAAGEREA
jgi:hypothetical protein